MKKDAFENSRMKYQLLEKKRNRSEPIIWSLTDKQKEYIEHGLGLKVMPYLYEVTTRQFKDVKNLSNFLKDLHYAYKSGKYRKVLQLNENQIKELKEYDVKFRVVKYKIFFK